MGIGIALLPQGRDMKLLRRKFLELTGGIVAASSFPQFALADNYPTRPVLIMTGFASGSAVDMTTRLVGHWSVYRLGQSFVGESRAGTGCNLGTRYVDTAPC